MAIYGWPNLKVELDDDGGTPQDISNFITTFSGLQEEFVLQQVDGAGEVTDRWASVGYTQKQPFTFTGPYDNVANGMVDITLGWTTGLRTLTLTFDMPEATDVYTHEVFISQRNRNAERGQVHEYMIGLRPG